MGHLTLTQPLPHAELWAAQEGPGFQTPFPDSVIVPGPGHSVPYVQLPFPIFGLASQAAATVGGLKPEAYSPHEPWEGLSLPDSPLEAREAPALFVVGRTAVQCLIQEGPALSTLHGLTLTPPHDSREACVVISPT